MPARDEILGAFRGGIRPVPVSLPYRLGLGLVAFMMFLLPLVYLGVIVGAGYGVYYHATEHTGILKARGWVSLIVYLAPIVMGGVLVAFMIKPLFAKAPKQMDPILLVRSQEPLLFEFVEKICSIVGAPKPREIRVDCQVNASASFRRGMLSFLGNDLRLTIGLPLVAGLTLRQFAGVLGHELGHFAQGTGMRLTYLIRTINFWLYRVVYERDSWDEWLANASKSIDLRIGIFLYLARLLVWLTRRVLWVLMLLGHGISSFMLRQMEYDADRYEARLAGSETFRSTAERLPVLVFASQVAYSALQQSWMEQRLCDNFPALVVFELGTIPEEERARTLKESLERKAAFGDTHPPDRARIESAKKEREPGIFALEIPASRVFRDFDAVAKDATFLLYREVVGDEVSRKNLIPTEKLVKDQQGIDEDQKVRLRYFQGFHDADRIVAPGREALEAPPDPAAVLEELRSLRAQFERHAPGVPDQCRKAQEARETLVRTLQADALQGAGFKIDAKDWGFSAPAIARRSAHDEHQRRLKDLAPAHDLLRRRLALALRLYQVPEFAARVPDADLAEIAASVSTLDGLSEAYADILDLLRTFHAADILCRQIQEEIPEALATALLEELRVGHDRLGRLRARLDSVVYPFEHADGAATVGSYAIPAIPAADDLGQMMGRMDQTIDSLGLLIARLTGRLAYHAERMETAVGMAPLPEPQTERNANQ